MKLTNTKQQATKVKILVYGPSGFGKTTLAKTLNGRTLIISAESGLLSIASEEIPVIDITQDDDGVPFSNSTDKYKKLCQAIIWIRNGQEFDNIFIDSATEISQIFLEHFQKIYPDRKDTLPMYGDVNKTLRSFLKTVRDLSQYNVIVTALEKEDKDNVGRKTHMPELQGKLAMGSAAIFDEVFNYRIIEKEDKEHRLLMTTPSDGRLAKDRSGKLEKFELPDLGEIINKIKGQKNV